MGENEKGWVRDPDPNGSVAAVPWFLLAVIGAWRTPVAGVERSAMMRTLRWASCCANARRKLLLVMPRVGPLLVAASGAAGQRLGKGPPMKPAGVGIRTGPLEPAGWQGKPSENAEGGGGSVLCGGRPVSSRSMDSFS